MSEAAPELQALFSTSEVLKVSLMLWHLVEVLFFEDEADVTPCLLEWLRDNYHETLTPLRANDAASLWSGVAVLVAQGQVRPQTRSFRMAQWS